MLSFQIKNLLVEQYPDIDFKLDSPEVPSHGHYATNIAFAIAKRDGMPPLSAAEKIKSALLESAPKNFFEKIDVVAPGFINFWLSKETIQVEFGRIAKAGETWGKENIGHGENVIVEYSSPNIAKPMHVGHFRSTIIGDALANIHKALGYKVIRWNYIGDWGTQFGKLTAAYRLWGSEALLKKEPIKHLLDLYVRFSAEAKTDPELEKKGQEEFRKLEDGDKENKKLWLKFRNESLKELHRTYKLLGVKFDIEIGESFYEKDLKYIISYLLSQNIATKSEGAIIVSLDDFNLPPAMIQKSDGATLYLTRDIANIIYRLKKYKPTKIVYEIGNEQELHFKQLFAIAKADFMPEMKEAKNTELTHVGHGLVLGEDGKKLSTRAGKTIFMEDVIDEAVSLTREVVEEKNLLPAVASAKDGRLSSREKGRVSKVVAIAALKYNDLSQNRDSNITFDWKKMLSFEGDSGPYLLYSYARLKSILRKSGVIRNSKVEIKNLSSASELELIMKLDRFPAVLEGVAKDYYPNHLASYLYDLSKSVNHFYETEPVLKSEKGVREARLRLIKSAANVLKTGLNLLGIEVLEKM